MSERRWAIGRKFKTGSGVLPNTGQTYCDKSQCQLDCEELDKRMPHISHRVVLIEYGLDGIIEHEDPDHEDLPVETR